MYPKSDGDYQVLLECGLPMNSLTEDFAPILTTVGKTHNITFNILDFTQLEQKMFEKVKAKWPFEATLLASGMVFKAPKKLKRERFETMVDAIKHWYGNHWLVVDVTEKKTAKSIKIFLSTRSAHADT